MKARSIIIKERATHFVALIQKLNAEDIERVVDAVLSKTQIFGDPQLAVDLGLVTQVDDTYQIANPMYREIIERAIADMQHLKIDKDC